MHSRQRTNVSLAPCFALAAMIFAACGQSSLTQSEESSNEIESELSTPKGIYVTSIGSQAWRFELYAGSTSVETTFTGELNSSANPTAFKSILNEGNDQLELIGAGRLKFRNTVSVHYDAFEVTYAQGEDVCLQLADSTVAVYVGSQKQKVTAPFSLVTLKPCGPAAKYKYKFNPGHYLAADSRGTWDTVLGQELPACPTIRGLRVRYNWEDLETAKNQYSFSQIENDLKRLAAVSGGPRKLQAMIQIRSFGMGTHVAPTYMRNDPLYGPVSQGGGEWEYASGNGGPGGKNLRLWNPHVVARLNALFVELGKRFNDEPHFEMIGLPESAPGVPVNTPDYTTDGYFDGMLDSILVMSASFPNTITRAMTSFPRNQLTRLHDGKPFIQILVENNVAFGWPDTVEHDSTLWGVNPDTGEPFSSRGIYYWALQPVIQGNAVIAPEVQNLNFVWSNETVKTTKTQNALGGYAPTIQDISDFAKTFNPHYIVWSRITTISALSGNPYYKDVYEFLNRPAQKVNAAGGLNTTRPTRIRALQ